MEAIHMSVIRFPVIDPVATGANICRLRKDRGLTVRDLQQYFGFEEPQAIYKWQRGQSLPSVDNLYALSALLQVPMNEIIISTSHIVPFELLRSFYTGIFSGTVGVAEFQNRLDPYPLALHGLTPAQLDRCLPRDEPAT
jgi:transcriptional regulator with XRE-family HTH domain